MLRAVEKCTAWSKLQRNFPNYEDTSGMEQLNKEIYDSIIYGMRWKCDTHVMPYTSKRRNANVMQLFKNKKISQKNHEILK